MFRNHDVGQFRADLLVEKLILLEFKAVAGPGSLSRSSSFELSPRHRSLRLVCYSTSEPSQPQLKRLVFENVSKKIRAHPRVSAVGGQG